jgi:hypothetical protein
MKEMTKLKLATTFKTQLSELLFKPSFWELTLFSNMTHLMMSANNYMQDKRKLLLLHLKVLSLKLLLRENAEPD